MRKYGSDKPDLRIPLEIRDVSDLFRESSFRAFAGKTVRALAVPGCLDRPRSFFDQTEARAKAEAPRGWPGSWSRRTAHSRARSRSSSTRRPPPPSAPPPVPEVAMPSS